MASPCLDAPASRSPTGAPSIAQRASPEGADFASSIIQAAKARFVRSFEMRNKKNATDYFLFFATNSRKGLEKMKEAMWRVDESGTFRFSDATVPGQLVLFEPEPNFLLLRKQIEKQFADQTVPIEAIEAFVLEGTAFLTGHYKRVLAEMERQQPPALEIANSGRSRRRGTFPTGTQIRFLSSRDVQPRQLSLF